MTSPDAKSMPAIMAAVWPKLRRKFTILKRLSAVAIDLRLASVRSELPSLTITTFVVFAGQLQSRAQALMQREARCPARYTRESRSTAYWLFSSG
jgi:hypothetical protein